MKQLFLVTMLTCLLFSCEKEPIETAEVHEVHCIDVCEVPDSVLLLGDWELIESYMDPGDGSGTFQPENSNKTITFLANGVIQSNENLCDMTTNPNTSNAPTSGTYTGNTINTNCNTTFPYDLTFQQTGNILIINYPCICGCQVKYRKL